MDDILKAALTDHEREHAAGLLDTEGRNLRQAVITLFSDLSDPLLSAEDVRELLGLVNQQDDLIGTLSLLTEEGQLEASDKTQRPFDPSGMRLYRRAGESGSSIRLVALESVD